MGPLRQLGLALRSVGALSRLSPRCWGLLLIYLLLATLLLAAVGWLVVGNQAALRTALLGYLLPESWHFAGDLLVRHIFASQARAVLVNATASGSLVLVSLFLFPLKERLSAAMERDAALTADGFREFRLLFQAWEEIKLVLLYLTAFMLIFWLGYHPDPTRKLLASLASYLFLFFTFAADFISPLLQRHGLRYSQVVKALFGQPLASLGFGAIFALPAILAGLLLKHHPHLSISGAVGLLFGANLLAIVWAAVGGTWLGAQLLDQAKRTTVSAWPLRWLALLGLLGVLAWNSYTFFSLGAALHHKSQILKCDYSVDWRSFGLDLPRLEKSSVKGFLTGVLTTVATGTIDVGAHMTVRIHNPTPFDVALEENRIEIRHGDTRVAETVLSPLTVGASQTLSKRLDFRLRLNPRSLLKGRTLLRNEWRITLFLEIRPDFEFPIYLLAPD